MYKRQAFIFLNVNPALAVRLPVIGELFDKIEETISYKGDYSDHSNILLPEKEINKLEAGEIVDSPYVQISNGITVAVSEVTYSGQAVYLAMTIHNEAAFPESFYENSVSEEIGYQTLYLECPCLLYTSSSCNVWKSSSPTMPRSSGESMSRFSVSTAF